MKIGIRVALALTLALLVAGMGSAQEAYPDGTELRLLQWSHFVPDYDPWFDNNAAEWGERNNVAVNVDHISLTEIGAILAAELDAGSGHTLIESPLSPAAFIDSLHDLRDINEAARERLGPQHSFCHRNAYLPAADKYYGFINTQIPNAGNYDIALWTDAGYPNGPATWTDLLEGGRAIYQSAGIPVGIGLSPEPDSEMAARSLIWSFGGSVQDEAGNVTLNSPETIAATKFLAQLQNEAMTAEVYGWGVPSNNQALIAGDVSFILNPASAYRSLQTLDAAASEGIGFTTALAGPARALTGTQVLTYVIPHYVEGAELAAAKQFILDHTANFSEAFYHSALFNLPCFPQTVPQMAEWLGDDPFGSQPADKFSPFITVGEWSVNLGYPGYSNPAIAQVLGENILPNMMARVALGEQSAEEAVAQTHERIEAIFEHWRAQGMVGG